MSLLFPLISMAVNQNTTQFEKLSETNYPDWTRQIRSHLNGQELWGYVDGSIPEPTLTLMSNATATTAAAPIPNPAYKTWFTIDQQIVNLLINTLTSKVKKLTIEFDTSKGIWDCLARHYTQKSAASASCLKLQLLELQKGTQTIDDYLQQAKSIADNLATIDKPVSDDDLVLVTLYGLGKEYMMLCTTLTQQPSLPDFTALRSRILALDAQQPRHVEAQSPTALFNQNPSAHNTSSHRVLHFPPS